MKIAVTDACIFIDLIHLKLLKNFFELPLEVHTTIDVYNELNDEQKEWLRAFKSVGKLVIHNLSYNDWQSIKDHSFPTSLSEIDKSVLFIAKNLRALIISSDKVVRKTAEKQSIECHGIIWIFDYLVESGLISKSEALQKIELLGTVNFYYRNNGNLGSEIDKRIKEWGGK